MSGSNTRLALPENAVWKTFDGDGPAAHFYHANGFPVGLYQPLLSRLQQIFRLTALTLRPTWPDIGTPPRRRDWTLYTEDLIAHLDQNESTPVVGIGHSMGAACTLSAAVRRPDLFRALILIEPVTASRAAARVLRLLPGFVVRRLEPIRGTLRRRDAWSSRDEFLAECRAHRAYRRFDTEALAALRQHGVTEDANGRFRLAFPKDWEAHNYMQAPCLMDDLPSLPVPCIVIRTRPSMFCSAASWRQWQALCPQTIAVENPNFGHLLPIENAPATYELINEALDRMSAM